MASPRSRWLAPVLLAAAAMLMASRGEAQAPVPAAASAAALLDRAFENLYGEDYVQTLQLVTRARVGRPVRRTVQITRKQSERPGKALVRFLEPFDVRDTAVLILENEGSADDMWVYLPALRLTRRISAAQRADSFFGTDLSYEDVEPKRAEDYHARWAAVDSTDPECALVEWKAREGIESAYGSMRSCIEPDRGVVRWTDFFRKGRRVKRLEIDPARVESVDEHFIPFELVVSTARTGTRTKLITERYELRRKIPDSLFSTWNLEAGDAARDRKRSGGS